MAEQKLQKKITKNFERVPGYKPLTTANQLGFDVPDDPKLGQLIKQKADQSDLLKLMEHKTNKVDSEQ